MRILAIDIGGTTIKSDVYDENLKSYNEFKELKTIANEKENLILETVVKLIDEKENIDAVAIASAGVCDSEKGEIIYSGDTIPGYIGTNFYNAINKPCILENDVNAAAYGELAKGNATENSFVLTVGTGIGGAVITNGEILHGKNFSAGEIGYIKVNGKDWQHLASADALSKKYKKEKNLEYADGKILFENYEKKEKEAIKIIDEFAEDFASGLTYVSYILNPNTIVIGGGIMARSEILIPKIKKELEKKMYSKLFMPDVLPAKLGNDAQRIGATYLMIKKLKINKKF
ncbi:MAG: ROK family protein [Peptoniphilaceae bacterium]|nr:ROK family protein [Peptoniphilaceae bacterium]MDY3738503.1 ROK family protein [Peptoniphilaceae bacterium]